MRTMRHLRQSIVTLAVLFSVLISNAMLADEPPPAQLTLDDLRTFTDVFNQVRRNYVEEVDDRTLLDAAIRGMLSDLDPHSRYLPNNDFEDLQEHSSGRYSGVGTEVVVDDGRLKVKSVIVDSPADKAGVNPGDIITAVNGNAVKGRFLPAAMDDMLGEPGTGVTLSILTPEGEQKDLELERKSIKVPTLGFRLLDEDIGYYRITTFHRDSAIDLEQSIASVKSDGIELSSLVIDLRDNSGGVLQPAVAIADGFLDQGVIVSTRGRNSVMQMEFKADAGEWLAGVPVVVLVNRSSASASEVLAAALQDNERAIVMGETTFGKGSVQSVLPLRNGAGIKLTTARYYTPSGRSIQAQGVTPDVILQATEAGASPQAVREIDLDGHLSNDASEKEAATGSGNTDLEKVDVDRILSALRADGIIDTSEEAS